MRRPSYFRVRGLVRAVVQLSAEIADEATAAVNFSERRRVGFVRDLEGAIADIRAAQRALGAVRICEACGAPFIGDARARFHSDTCRKRARRARQAEERSTA